MILICFLPAIQLRDMGKQVELRKFNEATVGLSTVEKLMAGVLYRFAIDVRCPAIFIMTPQAGDEPFEGLVFTSTFEKERFMSLVNLMFTAVPSVSISDIALYRLSHCVYVLVKNDFKEGVWCNYGFEISGADGVSIPA